MLKIIPDTKARISNLRLYSMEMNIHEISRFLITYENKFVRIPELINLISQKELEIFSEINWNLAVKETEIILIQKKRVPWSNVISNYSKGVIYYNPKIFLNMDDSGIIGNVVHETGHHFGFGHSFKWTSKRKYSGVYLIGYLYQFLSEKMYDRPLVDLEAMLSDELINQWVKRITKEIK